LDWIDGDAADPELPIFVCDFVPAKAFSDVLENAAQEPEPVLTL
jgi:hypothetical protein